MVKVSYEEPNKQNLGILRSRTYLKRKGNEKEREGNKTRKKPKEGEL